MESDLYTLMSTVKVIDVVVTVALSAIFFTFLFKKRKAIAEWLEHWRKKRNFEENILTVIDELKCNNAELQKEISKLWNVMFESKEVSKGIRERIYDNIEEVSLDVKELIGSVNHIKEQNKLSKRADLKEKIERIYRECSEKQVCTDIAFDTLRDLIDDYERNGGENSFVHSLVEKEMYKWKRIKITPTENQNGDESE